MIGVADDGGVDRASAAVGDDGGVFPVFGELAEHSLAVVESAGFVDVGENEALALVGDAGAALGTGRIRILNRRRAAGDECILAIVDGVGISVAKAEVKAVGHLATDGNGSAAIDAGGFALIDVDGAELRNGAGEGINARGKWTGEAGAELPGGESLHGSVAEQVYAGGIEDRILDISWRREIRRGRG